jgi:hypothetical protein
MLVGSSFPRTLMQRDRGAMTDHDTPDPWLRRVHALLAKAESTEYPSEAEALLAKAQELMSRHAIDEAMLRTAATAARSDVVTRTVVVEPPFAGPRASLLNAVARSNDCRMVIARAPHGRRHCTIVGHESDLDHVVILFTALSLHATRAMLQADPRGEGLRAFRFAFLLGFASRIGERLRRARDIARADAVEATGPSVALVLRDRAALVDQAFAERFPWVRSVRTQCSSWSGAHSGRAAADAAALGGSALRAPRSLEAGQ